MDTDRDELAERDALLAEAERRAESRLRQDDMPPTSPWTAPPTPADRPRGLDRLLGYVADRLPEPLHQVSIVLTLDGQPRVFSGSVSNLTNITAREALRAQAGAAYRAALHALENDKPWLPAAPSDPDTVDDVAADDNDYEAFLTVVHDADPTDGVRTRQILNRLNRTMPYKVRLTGQATIPDVIRWVRRGLTSGEIVAVLGDVDRDGLPLFVRRPTGNGSPE